MKFYNVIKCFMNVMDQVTGKRPQIIAYNQAAGVVRLCA